MKLSLMTVGLLTVALSACNQRAPAVDTAATPPPMDQPAQDVPPATASATPPPAVPAPAPVPGTWEGYGAAKFGASADAVKAAWGSTLDGGPDEDSTCYYLRPQPTNRGPALMFEAGKFVRYDVDTLADVAPGGGQVGMTIEQIRTAYGAGVEEQPHKYVEGAKTLRIKSTPGKGVLVFETDAAGKITAWRVGVPPQVDYVEGCS